MINPDSDLEKRLWSSADKLRSNMDAAEYKHVVLGLIFLKYVSDSFEENHRELEDDREHLSDPEDRDEYISRNVFWVPPEARWDYLQRNAKHPTVGKMIDDAMEVIERDNSSLKGVLPTNYSRASLDKQRLGELIDLIGGIELPCSGHSDRTKIKYGIMTSLFDECLVTLYSLEKISMSHRINNLKRSQCKLSFSLNSLTKHDFLFSL